MRSYYHILVRGRPIRHTLWYPYEFKTYQEALDMVSTCYGLEVLKSLKKDVEIIEINPYLKIK